MDNTAKSWHGPPGEVLTALIIDDEALIRQLIRRTLEPAICRVAEADNAEIGLRIIQQGAPPIDFVVTDVRMPGLNGWDVAEVLAEYRPDLPVGLISGYDAGAATVAQELGAPLLPKPFTLGALVDWARKLAEEAESKRTRAETHRARAGLAREAKTMLRRQHANLRARLDLVAAAWEVHRHPRHGR